MSLNLNSLNFGDISGNDTILSNNRVYSTNSLEQVAIAVSNTSSMNTFFNNFTNNINTLRPYSNDNLKLYYPYYISNEINPNYYHFVSDLSYVTVPPYTTCMIQQNLIFSYGYNKGISDPSAQIHNIYINYGCSNTKLSSLPYENSNINTAYVFSNSQIIPYSFNQKILVYTSSSKITPINNSFFYDNTTDTSQNIYLFASMQQYYSSSQTKISGKLVYNFIKNNSGIQQLTYNPFSTTYRNLLIVLYRDNYNTFNCTNLGSITIPANSTVVVHNAVSIKLQQMNMYDVSGVLNNMNYYFYSSTSSNPYDNMKKLDPSPTYYSNYVYNNQEVVNQSMKSVQLTINKDNEIRYLFDTNTFIYSNTTNNPKTLYLHFGKTYNTNISAINSDIKVTGTTGFYTLTNNTSSKIIKSNYGFNIISTIGVLSSLNIKPGTRYLSHIWTHHSSNVSYKTTNYIMTSLKYFYDNPDSIIYDKYFYPSIKSDGLIHMKNYSDLYLPNQINSVSYAGGINYGTTISTLGLFDTYDIKTNSSAYTIDVALLSITGISVYTVYNYILFPLD